jgi:hypothetical protein
MKKEILFMSAVVLSAMYLTINAESVDLNTSVAQIPSDTTKKEKKATPKPVVPSDTIQKPVK